MALFSSDIHDVVESRMFSDYAVYMHANEQTTFRVMSKQFSGPKAGLSVNFESIYADQVERLLPKLRGDNSAGRSIYIRPNDVRWVFLDLDNSSYSSFGEIPIIPDIPFSFGIQTAAKNHQLWFYIANVRNVEQQVACVRYLARLYNEKHGLVFDNGAMRSNQIGRCPGFRITKPGRERFWCTFSHGSDMGRFNLTLPLDEILFQDPSPNKRKLEPNRSDFVQIGNKSAADFGRCMTALIRSDGTISIPAQLSTLRNFSEHVPIDGDKENYYALTVANARLRWAKAHYPECVANGSYEIVMHGKAPKGYVYPGGELKPLALHPITNVPRYNANKF